MTDPATTVTFILLIDSVAKTRDRGLSLGRRKDTSSSEQKLHILKGSLLVSVDGNTGIQTNREDTHTSKTVRLFKDSKKKEKDKLVLNAPEHENAELVCNLSDVKRLSPAEANLLYAIPVCAERLKVFNDKAWIDEGVRIKEGDFVDVKLSNHQYELPGIVRYRGPVPNSKGELFGVELIPKYQGQGSSDGIFRKERFFRCPPDSAVFFPINKIRYRQSVPEGGERLRAALAEASTSCARTLPDDSDAPVRVGERVVWMSDDGPENGTVKWLGYLPDQKEKDLTVGVEFDRPVGTGTGKYKDQQLFRTRHKHASLIPLMGLLKEAELFPDTPPVQPTAPPPSYHSDDFVNIRQPKGLYSRGPTTPPQPEVTSKYRVELGRSNSDGFGQSNEAFLREQEEILNQISRVSRSADEASKEKEKLTTRSRSGDFVYIDSLSPSHHVTGPRFPVTTRIVNPVYELHKTDEPSTNSRVMTTAPNEADGHVVHLGSTLPPTAEYTIPEDLAVNSMVEVLGNPPKYGLIRWIGGLPESKDPNKLVAGLEMEEESPAGTDGTFNGKRYFHCAPKKAFFVYLHKCRKDSRFQESVRYVERSNSQAFGSVESPDEGGNVPPPDLRDLASICGKNKGIQGHHNSCYLDASLVSMFFFTHVFDSILFRPKEQADLPEYEEVQRVLKESIVNPLRKHFYVRADKVLNLRKLLDKLGTVQGMMGEEKDPEEFLSSLLQQIMRADPFIKLSNGSESFCYQLFVEKDERIVLPTTQQLLGLSCLQSDIKFAEIPTCLMIQMPRFGKDYKMYNRIVPSLNLDITDVLDNAPRECTICGSLAEFECTSCYKDFGPGDSLDQIAFCASCSKKSHSHVKRASHKPRRIKIPKEYIEYMNEQRAQGLESMPIQRETMELFAVVCIETSHYVAFIKTGFGPDAPWIFYDSMADRMGEQHGYNIPEIQPCPDLAEWLSKENHSRILSYKDDRHLPEQMRRLLCDAYMCFYQSTDVMMYK